MEQVFGFDEPIHAVVIGASGGIGGAFVSALLARKEVEQVVATRSCEPNDLAATLVIDGTLGDFCLADESVDHGVAMPFTKSLEYGDGTLRLAP